MQGEEFVQLISDSPEWVGRSMKDMARRREFNKALNKQHNGTAPLRDLFNMIDTDNDGRLSISEVKTVIKKFDPSFPDEVRRLLKNFTSVIIALNSNISDLPPPSPHYRRQ